MKGFIGVTPPLEMSHFAFLRDCPKPKLLVCGDRDTICLLSKIESFFQTLLDPKWLRILPGIEHFFFDRTGLLEGAIEGFLERMPQP